MKKITCLVLALVLLAGFCACSKLPEEPATTTQAVYSVVDEIASAEAAENSTEAQQPTSEDASSVEGVSETQAPTQVSDSSFISSYEFVMADYYIFNKSHVKILDIELVDYGLSKVIGFAEVEVSGLAFGESEIRVGCITYDANGEVLKTSYLLVPVKDAKLKEGDTMDCRFEIPDGTAKIEFVDYSAVAAEIDR